MNSFRIKLRNKLIDNLYNKHGASNHDNNRFGHYNPKKDPLFQNAKKIIKGLLGYKRELIADSFLSRIHSYESRLERIFEHLSEKDRNLLVDIIAFRILGAERILLPRNTREYWDAIETVKKLQVGNESYNPNFRHFILNKFDLNPIGTDVKLLFSAEGIAVDFIVEQYAYKRNGTNLIQANKGDTVIDAGGCWGDTALYFANKVGPTGKVYSFEFIPNNISIFNLNMDANPHLKSQIELVTHPLSDVSDQKIFYKDDGPASIIELSPFSDQTGTTSTLTIDAFVTQNNIQKVDFIKLDIEGAEPKALQGALETIRKFKPKLAIAIYHSMDDLCNIPNWILDLNLGYELYLDHFTIHGEETIIFANVKTI